MNAPVRLVDWSEANQQLLVAEFARLRALLGDDADRAALAGAEAEVAARRAAMPAPAAIDTLTQLFLLSAFERDLLLLVAGVEMDARIAALCGQGTGQPQRPWASFGLALAALPQPHWSALAPLEPLRRWRLLEVDDSVGIGTARLRPDERVLHYIAGLNFLDLRLQPLLDAVPPSATMSAAHRELSTEAAAALQAGSGRLSPLLLSGDDAAGQQDVAAAVAAQLGAGLYRLHAAEVPVAADEQAALAALWAREAALLGCGLLVTDDGGGGAASSATLLRFIGRLDGLVIVASRDPLAFEGAALRCTVDLPDVKERRRLWQVALGQFADACPPALDVLASQYRFGARRIVEIVAHAGAHRPAPDFAALHAASRSAAAAAMPGLAQCIDACANWKDLVLPDAQRRILHQVAVHARHRLTVQHDWGFAGKGTRGLGIATLFHGDSGTGKTLAAEVLAKELGFALYRIDLSAVVSKYIGETEKNLRRLFDAAEQAGAILLFDEADALFGKRSEVRDSHDRYANIEVSYLLQRMESYSGLAILTTNHKAALDPAFQRRLRFVVAFPFPDQAQREAIWRTVFPADTPLDGIDCAKLAQLNVAGGTIRNIALSAAFLAAEAGEPVRMAQLLHAAHLEAAKRDKPWSDAETRGWV